MLLNDRQLWLERRAIDTALDLLEPGRHDRLLDVATGTGAVLRRLALRTPPPCEVVGVDSSAAMLARIPTKEAPFYRSPKRQRAAAGMAVRKSAVLSLLPG